MSEIKNAMIEIGELFEDGLSANQICYVTGYSLELVLQAGVDWFNEPFNEQEFDDVPF